MDPFAPVAGVTIEIFATLSAEIAAARGDAGKVSEALAKKGASAAEWEQAQAGWGARLADPSMGAAIAPRFEKLYHEALDRLLGPAPDVPPDDVATMWGEALAVGLPALWQARRLDPVAWSRISYRARAALTIEPERFAASLAMAHLAAERRILSPSAAPRSPFDGSKDTPAPGAAPAQRFDHDATVAAKAVGKAVLSGLDAFGSAVDGLGKQLLGPSVGSAVLVHWSDGKKYPGTVAKVGKDQLLVTMGDGSQHWIPEAFVKAV